jgi:hypothetical protein
LWEAAGEPRRRCLAVLAPKAKQRELDRWIWWDAAVGRQGLERGVAHLFAQALKLRYEYRVHQRRSVHLQESAWRVEDDLEEVLDLLHGIQTRRSDRFGIEELLAAQDRLVREQVEAGGLLFGMSALRELRRTVLIAEANLKTLLASSTPAHSWFTLHPGSGACQGYFGSNRG